MGCYASQLQVRTSRFGCVSGIAAQSTSKANYPTKARLRAAPLTPKRATEIPVKKVLNEAPMEMATPSAPRVRLKPPVSRVRSAATTVIVTPNIAALNAFSRLPKTNANGPGSVA